MSIARTILRKGPGYAVTGGAAALIDLGVFALVYPVMPSIFLAAGASFIIAAVSNYLLSARLVYQRAFTSLGALFFVAGACVGLSVNASVAALLAGPGAMDPVVAKIGGIGVAFFVNFMLNTFIVFREGQEPDRPDR